jgi:hypothetical protein
MTFSAHFRQNVSLAADQTPTSAHEWNVCRFPGWPRCPRNLVGKTDNYSAACRVSGPNRHSPKGAACSSLPSGKQVLLYC